MEQKSVVERLMEQLRVMGELQQLFESSGKVLKKHEKMEMMRVEQSKLDALKQEQLAQAAPRVLPAQGQAEWGPVLDAANAAEKKARKKREDYVDFPCSKHETNPALKKHCTYTTFNIGREILRKACLSNTLYDDLQQTKEFMTARMGRRVGGAGVPGNGYLDWEFEDGRGFR
jgi:hypothetical protein